VIISVGYPPGSERPQLLDRLEARIEEQVGHDVTVELRLVSVERVERADETG
jgi:hypothetical protein